MLCRQRLREIDRGSTEANQEFKMQWIEELRGHECIAEAVDKANEQHYEVCGDNFLSFYGSVIINPPRIFVNPIEAPGLFYARHARAAWEILVWAVSHRKRDAR